MKKIIFLAGIFFSPIIIAGDDYVHLMTTHEKCTQWGERGKQIAAQFYAGDSHQTQYKIIEQSGGDADIVSFQKKQVDVVYRSLPKTTNVYEQILYAEQIAKAMYEHCKTLYEKQ